MVPAGGRWITDPSCRIGTTSPHREPMGPPTRVTRMDSGTRRDAARVAGLTLVAVACVLFLVVGFGRITAPFGDSDEGINGAVWAYSAQSLRDLGLVDSRLGGHRVDGTDYATHPP